MLCSRKSFIMWSHKLYEKNRLSCASRSFWHFSSCFIWCFRIKWKTIRGKLLIAQPLSPDYVWLLREIKTEHLFNTYGKYENPEAAWRYAWGFSMLLLLKYQCIKDWRQVTLAVEELVANSIRSCSWKSSPSHLQDAFTTMGDRAKRVIEKL